MFSFESESINSNTEGKVGCKKDDHLKLYIKVEMGKYKFWNDY